MRTAGQFLQDTPFTDLQQFIGPNEIWCNSGGTLTTNATASPLSFYWNVATISSTSFFLCALPSLFRTGTAPNYQEQFGTAALVPGPSGVSHTSDPLNLVGMPPTKKANLATLTGGPNGFIAKGLQLNSIDVIYQILTNAIASCYIIVDSNQFSNTSAIINTNLVAKGANGLQTAVNANPYVTRVPVATPNFIVTPDTEILISYSITTGGAAPSFNLFGFVANYSYNFN